jgi:hypothetical protein
LIDLFQTKGGRERNMIPMIVLKFRFLRPGPASRVPDRPSPQNVKELCFPIHVSHKNLGRSSNFWMQNHRGNGKIRVDIAKICESNRFDRYAIWSSQRNCMDAAGSVENLWGLQSVAGCEVIMSRRPSALGDETGRSSEPTIAKVSRRASRWPPTPKNYDYRRLVTIGHSHDCAKVRFDPVYRVHTCRASSLKIP